MTRGRHPLRLIAGVLVHARLAGALGPDGARRYARLRREHARDHAVAAATLHEAIWADAARANGATLTELGGGRREAHRDGRTVPVDGNDTGIDSRETFDRLLDKTWTHTRLTGAGLRVPRHRQVAARDIRGASAFLRATGGAVVVKPAGGTGAGWGITCGVRTHADLVLAMLDAGRYCPDLLLEEQAPGEMYRVLVLDGAVIDVVRRGSPTVIGDGSSTVGELIAAENRRRLDAAGGLGTMLLRADLDCTLRLRQDGLRLRSVPETGRVVTVKTSSSESQPADSETIGTPLHPALAEDVGRATRVLGVRLAGVDLVTPSLERPLSESGGAIVEVNASPGLRYHYQVRDRAAATPVARLILQHLFDQERT
jgi:cyanophycin synthetase